MGRLIVLGCVVSLGEVIITLPTRMEGSESDEEIFITQNRFCESSNVDVGFNITIY